MIGLLIFALIIISVLIISFLVYWDKNKLVNTNFKPNISIIIPTHNDGEYLEDTINSIYESYPQEKTEILVVNDCSTDNTFEILKRLNKKLNFKVISNKVNLGKVESINRAFKETHNDFILILDSDTQLNEKAMNEMLSRISNETVGLVSCRYVSEDSGFLAKMQSIEYGSLGVVLLAHNHTFILSGFGGCLLFRRDAFEAAGLFSKNAFTEDMDLTLKIARLGYSAQICSEPVISHVPTQFKDWVKQKLRWYTGGIQSIFNHIGVLIKNPIFIFFVGMATVITLLITSPIFFNNFVLNDIYSIFNFAEKSVSFSWIGVSFQLITLFNFVLVFLIYPFLTLPTLISNYSVTDSKPYHLLWIFPYSFVYLPLLVILNIVSIPRAIYCIFKFKNNKRAW